MNQTIPEKEFKWLYILIGAAVAVNLSGLFITIIAPDATLYATIAKNMVLHHNYTDLFVDGKDWLDKPHLPFWLTALSFNLFGFTTWAYKLPGMLIMFMGAWYTYLFAKSLYNKQVGLWSALILLTAEHIVISNNDVRAEPYLTGFIIAAVYYFYTAYTQGKFWQLAAGCAFTACAVMTKGIFALVPIFSAIAGHFIITKQWKQLFKLRWLIAVVLTAIFILPELYCLYQQFDLHPEKVVFGHNNVSGIRWFFWDSQFGRFTNSGPIKGGGDPFFFFHTLLWAFLPWSLLLFAGIYQFFKKAVKNVQAHEWFCICAALVSFLMFSLSRFQLPYYLNIIFPFFAIITAQFLYQIQLEKSVKTVKIVQVLIIIGLLVTVGLLEYYFLPNHFKWPVIILLSALYIAMVMLPDMVSQNLLQKILIGTVIASFTVNLFLNLAFYPSLLEYQSGSEAAIWINTHNPKNYPVGQLSPDYPWEMEFYLDKPLININPNLPKPPTNTFMLVATDAVINDLTKKGWDVREIYELNRYPVSRLKMSFLNERTRKNDLTVVQIVVVNSKEPMQTIEIGKKHKSAPFQFKPNN